MKALEAPPPSHTLSREAMNLLPVLALLLLARPLTRAEPVGLEAVVRSSPCSATCGLGVKTQTLCLVGDVQAAMEEKGGGGGGNGSKVTDRCRQRSVTCRQTWQCGLSSLTVEAGRRLELDCVGDVTAAVGRFSWRVAWRYARGVITSNDALFARWTAPQLERVVLDPVGEEHAGTYRCEVKDATLRRVKTVYWGVRVLPAGILNLDYDSAGARWGSGNRTERRRHRMELLQLVPTSLDAALILAGLVLLGLIWTTKRRTRNLENRRDL